MLDKYGFFDIIVGIICILTVLIVIFAVYFLVHKDNQKEELAGSFCSDGLVIGKGSINYCKGEPFVCNQNSCYWANKPKELDCWTEPYMVGKIMMTREVCE